MLADMKAVSERVAVPIIIGLVVGIAFVVSFSMLAATFQEQSSISESPVVVIPEGSSLQSSERNNFEPETITVVIGVNNTVTWVNEDTVPVGVSADNRSDPDFFNATQSKFLMPDETFAFTFGEPGTFGYHAEPGPWRQGTVRVLESN